MSNSLNNVIDPDGGCPCDVCPENCGDFAGDPNQWFENGQLDEIVIGGASIVTINSQGFDVSVSTSLFTVPELANSALSLGIDSYLDDIKYSDLLKTPKNHFAASHNGNTVYWKNNFRGNGSVSGSTVTKAKVDFTKKPKNR